MPLLILFNSGQAAKFHKEAGELFEGDLNYAKAIEHYQVQINGCWPRRYGLAQPYFLRIPEYFERGRRDECADRRGPRGGRPLPDSRSRFTGTCA